MGISKKYLEFLLFFVLTVTAYSSLLSFALSMPISSSLSLYENAQPNSLVFSRDDRPVDGSLNEISIVKNSDNTFSAYHRVAYFNFVTGERVDNKTIIRSDLLCTFKYRASSLVVSQVICKKDDLPVDGYLHQLEIKLENDGSYLATLRTAYADRINRRMVDNTKELGSGLKITMGGG